MRSTSTQALVPMGWYYLNPLVRCPNCSWCGTDTIDVAGFVVCPNCDSPSGRPIPDLLA
jgi:hypothetical protein